MLKAIHYALNCCGVAGRVKQFILDFCLQKDILSSISVKSCPEAIKQVFQDKLHILGMVHEGCHGDDLGMICSMILCCAIPRNQEVVCSQLVFLSRKVYPWRLLVISSGFYFCFGFFCLFAANFNIHSVFLNKKSYLLNDSSSIDS